MVQIISSSRYKINRKTLKKTVSELLLNRGVNENQTLNIIFVGRNKMKDITNRYKHENQTLPVLSFKYNELVENKTLLGEIFICYPQAVLLAAERSKKVNDMIIYLIGHGLDNIS